MAHWKGESAWMDDEDDALDPDYREDSDTDDEDNIPSRMGRDRARWIEDNVDELQELFTAFKSAGTKLFGNAFMQVGTINNFSNFCYKYTTPGAV
jgi:hypothetical protein